MNSSKLKYNPGLDALRGAAILLVLFFHLQIPGFQWGWVGVPLFFTLSGFLITKILIHESNLPHKVVLKRFYIKRMLRIFPLYYAFIFFATFLFLLKYGHVSGFWYHLVYLQNIINPLYGYSQSPYLAHTWSLAVEEQFYLIWPFIVIFWAKKINHVAWGMILLAPIIRSLIWFETDNRYLLFSSLPCAMDTISFGVILALCNDRIKLRLNLLFAFLFLIGIVCVCFTYSIDDFSNASKWGSRYLSVTLFSIAGMGGFFLIQLFSKITCPPLQWIGKISYSLYILHPIIFALFKYFIPQAHLAIPLIVSILVAKLSYEFFEKRFLMLKDRMFYPTVSQQEIQ